MLAIPVADYGEPAATNAGVVRGHDTHADGRGDKGVRGVTLAGVNIQDPLLSRTRVGKGTYPSHERIPAYFGACGLLGCHTASGRALVRRVVGDNGGYGGGAGQGAEKRENPDSAHGLS